MKKLLFLFLILFTVNAHASPDNSMSITPVAVTGAKITASDENSRNTVVSAAYNAHDHTDISRTANTLNIGDGAAGNKIINAYNADTNKPFIKYDDTANAWGISNDGVTTSLVVGGASLDFEGATNDAFETILQITDPTADRTQTFQNDSGIIPLGTAGNTLKFTTTGATNVTLPTTGTMTAGLALPSGAIFYMVTGNCPTGSTDVTATYSNKFVRANATANTTGGSDTYSLSIAEANLPSHTHAAGSLTGGAHTHGLEYYKGNAGNSASYPAAPQTGQNDQNRAWTAWNDGIERAGSGGAVAVTGDTGAIGSGTAKSIDTVPAYFTAKCCQVN